MTQLSRERSRGIWEIWHGFSDSIADTQSPDTSHLLLGSLPRLLSPLFIEQWSPANPSSLGALRHTTDGFFEARRASSLITHPCAARVSTSARCDSAWYQNSGAIKAQQAWGATSDPIVVFHPKMTAASTAKNQRWVPPPRSPIMKHPTHNLTHWNTYTARIETVKQLNIQEVIFGTKIERMYDWNTTGGLKKISKNFLLLSHFGQKHLTEEWNWMCTFVGWVAEVEKVNQQSI